DTDATCDQQMFGRIVAEGKVVDRPFRLQNLAFTHLFMQETRTARTLTFAQNAELVVIAALWAARDGIRTLFHSTRPHRQLELQVRAGGKPRQQSAISAFHPKDFDIRRGLPDGDYLELESHWDIVHHESLSS